MAVDLSVDLLWRFVIAGALCRDIHERWCASCIFLSFGAVLLNVAVTSGGSVT